MMHKLMHDSCSIETWPDVEAAVPLDHPDQARAAAAVGAAAAVVAHPPLGLPALADLLLQLAAQANHQRAAQAAVQVQVQVGPDHPILPEKSKLKLTTTTTTEDMRAATMCMMLTTAVAVVVTIHSLWVLWDGLFAADACAVLSVLFFALGNGKDALHAATEADKSMDSETS